MRRIVIDLDGTITGPRASSESYADVAPRADVVAQLVEYRERGFEIVIYTARNMRTFDGHIGKINAHTLPAIIEWLERHQVPYDEIIVGKPWCGEDGFYVDDRAIRPSEFANLKLEQIHRLIEADASQ